MISVIEVNELLNRPRWKPRWGWHDDHALNDKTDQYLPAIQQVKIEFIGLLGAIRQLPQRNAMLQLGMGPCRASHEVWRIFFSNVMTIDFGIIAKNDNETEGKDTHSIEAFIHATSLGLLDMLFIDAGHTFADVCEDWIAYSPLVKPGGLIALHDALPRVAYPEVEVHRFVQTLKDKGHKVFTIGDEVGTAWTFKQ